MLRAAQRRIAELEDQVKLLTAENQHLGLIAKARPGRGKGGKQAPVLITVPSYAGASDGSATSTSLAIQNSNISVEEITKWGNNFSIFYNPIISAKHFTEGNNLSTCTFLAHDSQRWLDEKNHALGISIELYGLLPKKFHSTMLLTGSKHSNNGSFAKRVSDKIILFFYIYSFQLIVYGCYGFKSLYHSQYFADKCTPYLWLEPNLFCIRI